MAGLSLYLSLLPMLLLYGLSIYALLLLIKALKIYIRKNQ